MKKTYSISEDKELMTEFKHFCINMNTNVSNRIEAHIKEDLKNGN